MTSSPVSSSSLLQDPQFTACCQFYDVLIRCLSFPDLCVYTCSFVCFYDRAILKGLTSKFVLDVGICIFSVLFLCRHWFHGFDLRKDEKSFEECNCVQWSLVVLILQSSY